MASRLAMFSKCGILGNMRLGVLRRHVKKLPNPKTLVAKTSKRHTFIPGFFNYEPTSAFSDWSGGFRRSRIVCVFSRQYGRNILGGSFHSLNPRCFFYPALHKPRPFRKISLRNGLFSKKMERWGWGRRGAGDWPQRRRWCLFFFCLLRLFFFRFSVFFFFAVFLFFLRFFFHLFRFPLVFCAFLRLSRLLCLLCLLCLLRLYWWFGCVGFGEL